MPDGRQAALGHLMIAGTGRAGTSFLVRYLTELGYDTEMGRSGGDSWNDSANAGFEDPSVLLSPCGAPQVIKSPWLYEYLDELLEKGEITLNAVIIPIRDLTEAASSRTLLELQAMHQQAHWMVSLEKTWETWCTTPGGIVYSVNPLDQARILAVGFHKLIERLVRADIPILFLEFPKLVTDSKYLFDKLKPFLSKDGLDEAQAAAAHARIADLGKVRICREIADEARRPAPVAGNSYPAIEHLDGPAIRRELARTRGELDRLHASFSWWLTKPIRTSLRLIQRLFGTSERPVSR